jgi:hypothetical protein
MDSEGVSFLCCFCGAARDDTDAITIAALWAEDGQQREQYWPAHRACLIERMTAETREQYGGPLFGN